MTIEKQAWTNLWTVKKLQFQNKYAYIRKSERSLVCVICSCTNDITACCSGPSNSSPSFSMQSRIIRPCDLVRHFPVLHFQSPNCSLYVVVQGPGRQFSNSVRFLYHVPFWSFKVLQFSHFAYFSYTQRQKSILRRPACNPAVTSQNASGYSM